MKKSVHEIILALIEIIAASVCVILIGATSDEYQKRVIIFGLCLIYFKLGRLSK